MSKHSNAKAIQNYTEKPFRKACENCDNYRSEKKDMDNEKNKHCHLGGFSVRKTALCEDWKTKI